LFIQYEYVHTAGALYFLGSMCSLAVVFGLVHKCTVHIWWLSLTVPMGLLPSIRPAIHPYTQTIGDIEQAIVFTSLASWRIIMGAI
jgi:hypothetical protein